MTFSSMTFSGPARGAPWLMDTLERADKIFAQSCERLMKRGVAANQHIVASGPEPSCVRKPHDFTQSPPHPIPLDCVADLLRYRKTDPGRPGVGTFAGLQHESRRGGPGARRDAEEVRPLPQSFHGSGPACLRAQALSRLRPRARRALSTLRPPLVAIRLRKPWRRLRTNLLG
jgi:hypothetical protein